MATNTAPGLFRRWWPFVRWPDFQRSAWAAAIEEAEEAAQRGREGGRDGLPELWGNDVHGGERRT
jgi:23S rRNA G2445 N2-methylase RlmL